MEDESEEVKLFKRHIGRPSEIKIGEDTLKMSPLTPKQLPELITLSARMSKHFGKKIEEGDTDKMAEAVSNALTIENLNLITELGCISLKPNYPTIDDEMLKEVVMKNALQFFFAMIEQNMSSGDVGERKKQEVLQRIRERQNVGSN